MQSELSLFLSAKSGYKEMFFYVCHHVFHSSECSKRFVISCLCDEQTVVVAKNKIIESFP